MKCFSGLEFLNVGTGEDITIAGFARLIAEVVGFRGKIEFDALRPDGGPQNE
jgi:GDP-L-fucose synthase